MKRESKRTTAGIFLFIATLFFATAGYPRDIISIVGSSTVFPFATVAAERFGRTTGLPVPLIEATGSGGGFQLFCSGTGINTPDIVNTSRPATASEIDLCRKNCVQDIIEIKIGYDGIVLANSVRAAKFHLQQKELYQALAKEIPGADNPETVQPNFYTRWSQINKELPSTKILVYGPPPTSGTRDFLLKEIEQGALSFPLLEALHNAGDKEFTLLTNTLREDGSYINAGENDNFIVKRLLGNPQALGIFGYSFLKENSERLQAATLNGVEPTPQTISDGSYPGARPLFIYVKKQHIGIIPGIRRYLKEFTEEQMWGDNGYLEEKGMIPLHEKERVRNREIVRNLNTL